VFLVRTVRTDKFDVDLVLEDISEMDGHANLGFLAGNGLASRECSVTTPQTDSNAVHAHLAMSEMDSDVKDAEGVKVALATQVRNPEPYDFIN
jgi:hypothetical protein